MSSEKDDDDLNSAGGIPTSGYISPFSPNDSYPTHKDIFGKGGYRGVYDIVERDLITLERRKLGMLVYVHSEKTTYILEDVLTNEGWQFYYKHTNPLSLNQITIKNGEILIGNFNNKGMSSAVLQEMGLDILKLKRQIDSLKVKTPVKIGKNRILVEELNAGYLRNDNSGNVYTTSDIIVPIVSRIPTNPRLGSIFVLKEEN